MKPTHIFFDLDHTLWDFDKNSALTFKKIFELNRIPVNVEKFLNYYQNINLKYWRLYRVDKVTKEQLRYGRLKDTFEILKIDFSDDVISKLSEDYITYLSTFNHLFHGTHELLTYLKTKYTLHIITNGFIEVQNKKLENSGIRKYFDQIITSEQVGVKKPNSKVFKYALQKAGAINTESFMIGDSWEADIMGAKNYGLNVIYCNFGNETVGESIPSVKNLLEIKNFL
ncbi:YjjG family noncanonical pyrimidine nucleotidase [Urechidicola vernalis]|uniref:YjjG family noncanonical pyrimidine nucleotidase n=1 Tax=Urechidicola vernalis TaxID=3075600 RepID=A0ABU2Y303_9FLAO|nr:YjjG family noncanonical pyrimidine nucleotidase [Urechidicola sp. P050]MDT0552594.1 YjjG family noncanonical pyrimidine nucleotidase [Urechidicola sp. P050]